MKLDPNKDYGDWYWVGHPDAGDTSEISTRRYEVEIHGGIQDEEASYSYDDYCLCELDNKFYLLNTSGCSCPSPTETWGIEIGPVTLEEVRQFILGDHYSGYSVPKRQLAELIALIDRVQLNKYGQFVMPRNEK
jgi:hypothetical protein